MNSVEAIFNLKFHFLYEKTASKERSFPIQNTDQE